MEDHSTRANCEPEVTGIQRSTSSVNLIIHCTSYQFSDERESKLIQDVLTFLFSPDRVSISELSMCSCVPQSRTSIILLPDCKHVNCMDCKSSNKSDKSRFTCYCGMKYDKSYLVSSYLDAYFAGLLIHEFLPINDSTEALKLASYLTEQSHYYHTTTGKMFHHFEGSFIRDFHRVLVQIIAAGNPDKLLISVQELLDIYGEQPLTCYLAMHVYFYSKDWDRVTVYLRRLEELSRHTDPDSFQSYFFKSILCTYEVRLQFSQTNWLDCLRKGRLVLRETPTNISLYSVVANALVQLNRVDEAKSLLIQGVAIAKTFTGTVSLVLETELHKLTISAPDVCP